jgi:hypothetical protein
LRSSNLTLVGFTTKKCVLFFSDMGELVINVRFEHLNNARPKMIEVMIECDELMIVLFCPSADELEGMTRLLPSDYDTYSRSEYTYYTSLRIVVISDS